MTGNAMMMINKLATRARKLNQIGPLTIRDFIHYKARHEVASIYSCWGEAPSTHGACGSSSRLPGLGG